MNKCLENDRIYYYYELWLEWVKGKDMTKYLLRVDICTYNIIFKAHLYKIN